VQQQAQLLGTEHRELRRVMALGQEHGRVQDGAAVPFNQRRHDPPPRAQRDRSIAQTQQPRPAHPGTDRIRTARQAVTAPEPQRCR
jgi:hypothetical protein